MNKESLEQLKKELKRKKDLRNQLKIVELRLEKLQKTKDVREYLELKKLDTKENRKLLSESEERIESETIYKYLEDNIEEETIFYCVGKNFNAHKVDQKYFVLNLENSQTVKVALYKSLSSTHQVIIEVGKETEFEKKNRVILTSVPSIEEYHKIQREYFEKAFELDEEESKQYILGKYRSKE